MLTSACAELDFGPTVTQCGCSSAHLLPEQIVCLTLPCLNVDSAASEEVEILTPQKAALPSAVGLKECSLAAV